MAAAVEGASTKLKFRTLVASQHNILHHFQSHQFHCKEFKTSARHIPGDAIKRDPERENCAVLTIAAQTANSIHIRVTFIAVPRYSQFPFNVYKVSVLPCFELRPE